MNAKLIFTFVIVLALAGCENQTRQPIAQETAPKPDLPVTTKTKTPDPDLNYLKVDVVDGGTVWNDWSQSRIRVVKAITDSSGNDIYFTCDTALRGKGNKILTYNGKPLPNHVCFQPKLHVVYTLMSLGDGSQWYWMNPPGDDGEDETDGKHPLVQYCPQCKPHGESQ